MLQRSCERVRIAPTKSGPTRPSPRGCCALLATRLRRVYCTYVVVHPDYQRAGIGSELVRRMQARYATYRQQVLLSATGAVTFYERLGFSLSRAPGMQLEPPPQLAVESRPL